MSDVPNLTARDLSSKSICRVRQTASFEFLSLYGERNTGQDHLRDGIHAMNTNSQGRRLNPQSGSPPLGSVPLLTLQQVADLLAVGKRTLERWIAAGNFPRPDFRSGQRVLRWRLTTVQAWIGEKEIYSVASNVSRKVGRGLQHPRWRKPAS